MGCFFRVLTFLLLLLGGVVCELGHYLFHESEILHGNAFEARLQRQMEEAKSLMNLGILFFKTGRHEMALTNFEKALKVFIQSEDHDEATECLKNIGDLYAEWGDFDKSFSYLFQALAHGAGRLSPTVLAEHLLNIGLTYRKKWIHFRNVHDLFHALTYARRALETKGLQNHERIARSVLTSIGVIHNDIGQYEEALGYFRKGEEMISGGEIDEELVGLFNEKGRALLGINDVDQAAGYFKRAVESAEEGGWDHLIWESHTGLGECYRKEKNHEKSFEYFTKAIETIEKIRSGISADIFKTGFGRNKMQPYHGVIDLLYKKWESNPSSERLSDLFSSVEKAKARAFLESLSSGPSASEYGVLKDHQNPISLRRIQFELLDEKTALVEYFLGDPRSLVFVVTQESCRVFPLPPRRAIEKQMKGYLRLISQLPEETFANQQASERIAEDLLFSSFRNEQLENIDALIIVPDGLLHFLPFESLRIAASNPTQFLVERFWISYATSASTLFVLNQKKCPARPRKTLLAFGNPKYRVGEFKALPYSRKEIAAISKMFPKRRIDVFEGKNANKALLKSLHLSDYQILHFACHGDVDEKFPLRSALVLSPTSKEDNGILQVREIYGMRMNADLVVLSACRSGGGRIEYSEGIVGLPRVFFSAGSRSVLASLWPIRDDAAAKMMRFFYEGLSEGKNKSQALRSAKLKMLMTRYSHPHYWAAFVLHGESTSSIEME
ncbi:MAG: CHAT domain-containing protein [Acidobacteriota bacterium]|nr:CHAT domain-containing protein [Acidobacteriota bacterium]